jgi:NADPH:quinone reductase-like Zn-dependent oxidoreductase
VHAVTILDGELAWRAHPDPVPGDTDLLVEVRGAGVNAADLIQRLGLYPAPPGWPSDIPGMELAGVVVATGVRTNRFAVGDRVMAVVGGGAQAELALVDEVSALPVPDGMAWEEAGGFAEAYSTAHDALFSQCHLAMGERVLVTGAAGGVGMAAVQLAVATGAHCVASVRDPARRAALDALGAEGIDPADAPRHGPFDVALELIGATSLPTVLEAMALGGRIAVIGMGGGSQAQVELGTVMRRRLHISGSTLRARSPVEKAAVAAAVERHALPLARSGALRVLVEETFPLSQATAAYERFAAGGKLGKIVLVPASG